MNDNDRPGNSGVFKAIVASARKLKRAVTGGGELEPIDGRARELAERVGQAFIAGRLDDVHAMGTLGFQDRLPQHQFVPRWRELVKERGTLTGFEITSAGNIELGFVPGLEEVPQSQYLGFLAITFSDPKTLIDDERAFTIGAVIIEDEGAAKLGALHKR